MDWFLYDNNLRHERVKKLCSTEAELKKSVGYEKDVYHDSCFQFFKSKSKNRLHDQNE